MFRPALRRALCGVDGGRAAGSGGARRVYGRAVGPYMTLPIFCCNKRGRGDNILRNIVGNKDKSWLGGGGITQ